MPSPRERWRRERIAPALYDFGVKHQVVARPLGRLMWGPGVGRLYRDIELLGAVPEGSAILDVPCGGGVAFRGLPADRRLRYVAADLSPVMLERARREAERLGLGQIEVVEADVESLPFEDDSFDLCISYNSLHCFSNPQGALTEMARALRPGGTLRGSSAVTGAGRRHDALIRLYRRAGIFGACGSSEDLRLWLGAAGLENSRVEAKGAIAFFSAVSPG